MERLHSLVLRLPFPLWETCWQLAHRQEISLTAWIIKAIEKEIEQGKVVTK